MDIHVFVEFIKEWEWVLLISVALLECIILINSFIEKREREHLINEMQTTRIELGRESYLSMIMQSLSKSSKFVYYVSHTLSSGMSDEQKQEFFKLYKHGIDHRCITGKDPGKVKYMFEQQRKGVEIRVNDLVMVSTFRYQVSDGIVILGFTSDGDKKSRKGIFVNNQYFAHVMRDNFIDYWKKSTPFDDYLKELVLTLELKSNIERYTTEWELLPDEITKLQGFIH